MLDGCTAVKTVPAKGSLSDCARAAIMGLRHCEVARSFVKVEELAGSESMPSLSVEKVRGIALGICEADAGTFVYESFARRMLGWVWSSSLLANPAADSCVPCSGEGIRPRLPHCASTRAEKS